MDQSPLPILVADDQSDVIEALRLLFKSHGLAVQAVTSPEAVIGAVKARQFGCALIDLNYSRDTTSGREGLQLLSRLREVDGDLPVVVMTAWATIDVAVQAIQQGAGDFIEKPWENHRLMSVLRTQLCLGEARRREARLARENELLRSSGGLEFVAQSAAMKPVLEAVRRVAPSQANVLILGENGTGKGLIGALLHAKSSRADRPLIKVNMGGISDTVFESEIFGHVKGAYTDAKGDRIGRFELADGGTLFLDEIGNVPLAQQPKLLRVLEDGELERLGSSRTLKVDVRLISATNSDIASAVANGSFRKDLLYRLNTVEIRLPPLRERHEDVLPLAAEFLQRHSRRYRKLQMNFSPDARSALLAYRWPGNIRELSHVIERAVLMAPDARICAADLNLQPGTARSDFSIDDLNLERTEERLTRRALAQTGGKIQQAADLLGVSRPALYRRLEKFQIESSEQDE
jgi:DNA-binding NtrC family response regulator